MQKELDDRSAVASQVPFEVIDRFVAMFPELFLVCVHAWNVLGGDQIGMNLDDEDLFVIRAVEDADAAALGQRFGAPPEKVMVELFRRRMLERIDLNALWID